jgi:hypothetical protein
MQAVQLLARSVLPPHIILPHPQTDSIALGVDPSGWEAPGMAGIYGTDTKQQQQQSHGGGGGMGFCAPPTTAPAASGGGGDEVEHVECRQGGQGMSVYVCTCVYVCACVCVSMCACVCVSMHVCV